MPDATADARPGRLRVVVHDFAGHAFAIPLSRVLAARGHNVLHLYCGKVLAPRGTLSRRPADPATFEIHSVDPRSAIDKNTLVRRRLQEIAYSRDLVAAVDAFAPDVVLSGNAPLDSQRLLLRWAGSHGARFVFWLQDLIGVGAERVLRRRFGFVGRALGAHFRRLEGRLLRRSDRVVSITEDFLPVLEHLRVDPARVRVIENWAPLDEVPVRPRDNPWARRHGLGERRVLLYSGTLGMKHDPRMLLHLARRLRHRDDVRVVVVSEGRGADWLARSGREDALANLVVAPYQPFSELPDVLASAHVLLALLEPDAGVFSVPSKVLTALCARRPLLLAVPAENLAARIVVGNEAGLAVAPDDREGFVAAAVRLLDDPALSERLAANGRRYAEQRFDVQAIASEFEEVFGDGRQGIGQDS